MAGILDQLQLNGTFFLQFIIFTVVFLIIGQLFFKPYMKLFEERRKRTLEDRKAAEKLMADAEKKLKEYQEALSNARSAARESYEQVAAEAKKEEERILSEAREKVKNVTQEAVSAVDAQRDELKRSLEADVNALAQQVADKLTASKQG